MNNFKLLKLQNKKSILYWKKVCKIFHKKQLNNIESFSMEFKHNNNIFSNFQPDDEYKINAYALEYGYIVIDEKLTSNKSIYYFKKET